MEPDQDRTMQPEDYYFSTPFEWEGKEWEDDELLKRTYIIVTPREAFDANSMYLGGGTPQYTPVLKLLDVPNRFSEDTECLFSTEGIQGDELQSILENEGFLHNESLDSFFKFLIPDKYGEDDW